MEKRGGKELPLQTQDTSGQMQLFLTSFLPHSLVWLCIHSIRLLSMWPTNFKSTLMRKQWRCSADQRICAAAVDFYLEMSIMSLYTLQHT